MLEANDEVDGKAKFRTPTLSKPPNQFGWRFKYITMSAKGVDVHNLVVEIDSAVRICACVKNEFSVDFFVNISIDRSNHPVIMNALSPCIW